jgi:D-beta-D-heptose 7-phosphate kinase/D-beta-D-heptose 1-phosphate adenosyltransferase
LEDVVEALTWRAREQFLSTVPIGDVLLISDYGKGVLTKGLLSNLVGRARDAGVPTLVDPARSRCWSDYGQVTLIKANWMEAKEAASVCTPRPLALARSLADRHGCHVVVTLGGHGMVCAEQEGGTWYLPAERVEVRHVCGAGDTVLAAIGAAISRGQSLRGACGFASRAASQQIATLGISSMATERTTDDTGVWMNESTTGGKKACPRNVVYLLAERR